MISLSSPDPVAAMSLAELAEHMVRGGFRAKLYAGNRIYIAGYGRDISAWLTPPASPTASIASLGSADGLFLHVRSSWRSPHNGLRCKGVKHAILTDLHAAGFLSSPPPGDWRRVALDEPRNSVAASRA